MTLPIFSTFVSAVQDRATVLGIPQKLHEIIDTVPQNFWKDAAYSLGGAVAALVLGRVVAALLIRGLTRWAKHTHTIVDDIVVEHLAKPIRRLLPVITLSAVMPLLSMPDKIRNFSNHLLTVLIIIGMGWIAAKSVRIIEEVIQRRYDVSAADNLHARAIQTQMRSFRNIAGFIIIVLTAALVLVTFDSVRQLGAGLLASAGIAGIVIGFAAQRSIATLLACIQIAMTQPIRVDDVVIVEGEWGRIEEITLTYVVVKIWDLRRLVVPITYFIEKPFQNWTRVSADILGTVFLYLDYSVPLDALRTEFKRVLDTSPLFDGKVHNIQVTDASEKTMTVRMLMSARNASDAWDLRCMVRESIIRFVQENYPSALPRFKAEVETALPRA